MIPDKRLTLQVLTDTYLLSRSTCKSRGMGHVRFVVGGRELDLTADEVVRGMRGAEPEPIREHHVLIGDNTFPPKQVLAQATGWDRQTFTTMEALRVLKRLGFGPSRSHRAGQRVDGRPAWVPGERTDVEEQGSVTVEERFAAVGVGVQTVGELIERLGRFDPAAPVRVQHALSSKPNFIIGVGQTPDVPGTVAIVYLPQPSQAAD